MKPKRTAEQQAVEEAIRRGMALRTVFFRESAHALAERLLPQIGSHVETLLLPDKLFDSAVPSESPQGVAALVLDDGAEPGADRA